MFMIRNTGFDSQLFERAPVCCIQVGKERRRRKRREDSDSSDDVVSFYMRYSRAR